MTNLLYKMIMLFIGMNMLYLLLLLSLVFMLNMSMFFQLMCGSLIYKVKNKYFLSTKFKLIKFLMNWNDFNSNNYWIINKFISYLNKIVFILICFFNIIKFILNFPQKLYNFCINSNNLYFNLFELTKYGMAMGLMTIFFMKLLNLMNSMNIITLESKPIYSSMMWVSLFSILWRFMLKGLLSRFFNLRMSYFDPENFMASKMANAVFWGSLNLSLMTSYSLVMGWSMMKWMISFWLIFNYFFLLFLLDMFLFAAFSAAIDYYSEFWIFIYISHRSEKMKFLCKVKLTNYNVNFDSLDKMKIQDLENNPFWGFFNFFYKLTIYIKSFPNDIIIAFKNYNWLILILVFVFTKKYNFNYLLIKIIHMLYM